MGYCMEGLEKFVCDVFEDCCFFIVFKDQCNILDFIVFLLVDVQYWVLGLCKIIYYLGFMDQWQKLWYWIYFCL